MEVVTLSQEDLCVYLAAVIDDSSLEKLKGKFKFGSSCEF